jgi:hypothetical protein
MIQVFGYKGIIGIDARHHESFVNDPYAPGQLGFVALLSDCQFNAEAKELLSKVKRSKDDIGEVDFFNSLSKDIFAWLGGPIRALDINQIDGSNNYNYELVNKIEPVEFDLDPEFIKFVESL